MFCYVQTILNVAIIYLHLCTLDDYVLVFIVQCTLFILFLRFESKLIAVNAIVKNVILFTNY